MIFSLLIIHNRDRMSSIARVLHTTTWDYFTEKLADSFIHSPNVVREEIMADINDLVQEFQMSSRDGAVGESFLAMWHLLKILQVCLQVCYDIILFFATAVDFADENLQAVTNSLSWLFSSEFRSRFEILFNGYRKMIDHSFLNPKI